MRDWKQKMWARKKMTLKMTQASQGRQQQLGKEGKGRKNQERKLQRKK